MTVEELQKKVEAAEQKVEKSKQTIERHKAQKEKKGKKLQEMGFDPESEASRADLEKHRDANLEAYWLLSDYDYKQNDIDGAILKLKEAERICNGWKEKLDLQINREKVIQETVPEVIKEFLQKWKEDAFDWYVNRHAAFLDFKKDLRQQEREAKIEALKTLPEYEDLRQKVGDRLFESDFYLNNPWPRNPMDKFLKEKELDYKSISKKINGFGDGVIFKMCEFSKESERLAWLDKTLEAEKKYKMLDLVERVTRITGPITDAKALSITAGDLNGVVLGEKGAAHVQTISAGGYNIQCFHYRVLINDITKKLMPPKKEKASLSSKIQAAQSKQEKAASPSHSKTTEPVR